jgi:hypothetical protein
MRVAWTLVCAGALLSLGVMPSGASARLATAGAPSRFALANQCWTMASARDGRFVATAGARYRAARSLRAAARLHLEPSRLGAYLLYDQGRMLATAEARRAVTRGHQLGKRA